MSAMTLSGELVGMGSLVGWWMWVGGRVGWATSGDRVGGRVGAPDTPRRALAEYDHQQQNPPDIVKNFFFEYDALLLSSSLQFITATC